MTCVLLMLGVVSLGKLILVGICRNTDLIENMAEIAQLSSMAWWPGGR